MWYAFLHCKNNLCSEKQQPEELSIYFPSPKETQSVKHSHAAPPWKMYTDFFSLLELLGTEIPFQSGLWKFECSFILGKKKMKLENLHFLGRKVPLKIFSSLSKTLSLHFNVFLWYILSYFVYVPLPSEQTNSHHWLTVPICHQRKAASWSDLEGIWKGNFPHWNWLGQGVLDM